MCSAGAGSACPHVRLDQCTRPTQASSLGVCSSGAGSSTHSLTALGREREMYHKRRGRRMLSVEVATAERASEIKEARHAYILSVRWCGCDGLRRRIRRRGSTTCKQPANLAVRSPQSVCYIAPPETLTLPCSHCAACSPLIRTPTTSVHPGRAGVVRPTTSTCPLPRRCYGYITSPLL